MQLVPGMVLYLSFSTLKPSPKEKFAVLCSLDPKPMFLLINSEQNAFVINTPEMAAHNLVIDVASHPFLNYDSWLDCTVPFGYDLAELLSIIGKEPSRIKGKLSQKLVQATAGRIGQSDLWPPKKAARVVASLSNPVGVDIPNPAQQP